MSRDELEAVARKYIAALNASTWEELKAAATPLIAEDIDFQEPSAVGTHRGRETFLKILKINKDAFPDMVWSIEESFTSEESVAIRWRGRGQHKGTYVLGGMPIPATQRHFDLGGFAVLTCRDGQIAVFRGHPDKYTLMMQLGVLLVPPTSLPPEED